MTPSQPDRDLVIGEFDNAQWPLGSATLEHAWLGIYQVLWWYAHGYLHIREANDLRKKTIWQSRAREAEQYIADALGVSSEALPDLVDRMMQLPRWQSECETPDMTGEAMQRNNPLGHGLRMLVSEVLTRWGNPQFSYPEESVATNFFPGIQMPGRSTTPRMDVAAVSKNRPKAVISCKWSIRHDRISDPTNECTQYKAAAINIQLMDLFYCLVTNELDGKRLDKVLNQPCVDALVHVHLPLAEFMNGGGTELMQEAKTHGRLVDLTGLAALTHNWSPL